MELDTSYKGNLRILTDDVEQNPTSDFVRLSKTISRLILDSHPKFTIGIFGDWGTGKTTLMKSILHELNSKNKKEFNEILPIWFNAWQHERGNRNIGIDFIKKIAFTMADHPKFARVSKAILDSLRLTNPDVLSKFSSNEIKNSGTLFTRTRLSDLDRLEQETIFFDGLYRIEDKVQNAIKNGGRIVVFIDDLDRCNIQNTLNVLELIKLFFDIEGFVFIISLNPQKLANLISQTYNERGINGEDLIKKIIQIPITLPAWDQSSTTEMVKGLIPKIDKKYAQVISSNQKIIFTATQNNPREIKRFLNNFIFACENNFGKVDPHQIIVIQALRMRWDDFYENFTNIPEFRNLVWKFLKMPDLEREGELESINIEKDKLEHDELKQLLLSIPSELWFFLKDVENILFKIEDQYERRNVPKTPKLSFEEKIVQLLRKGNIEKFNEIMDTANPNDVNLKGTVLRNCILQNVNLSGIDLRYVDFTNSDLRGSDLSKTDLRGSKLVNANLDGSNLVRANLEGADLTGAQLIKSYLMESYFINSSLRRANLQKADLSYSALKDALMSSALLQETSLEGSNLEGADLSSSNLRDADLTRANLTGANLTGADMRGAKLEGTVLKDAKLEETIKTISNPLFEQIISEITSKNMVAARKLIKKAIRSKREEAVEFLLEDPRSNRLIPATELKALFGIDHSLFPAQISKSIKYLILSYVDNLNRLTGYEEANVIYLKNITNSTEKIFVMIDHDSDNVLNTIISKLEDRPSMNVRIIVNNDLKNKEKIHKLLDMGVTVKQTTKSKTMVGLGLIDDNAFISIPYGPLTKQRKLFFVANTIDANRAIINYFLTIWNSAKFISI